MVKIIQVLQDLGADHQIELPVTEGQRRDLLQIDHQIRITGDIYAQIIQLRHESLEVTSVAPNIENTTLQQRTEGLGEVLESILTLAKLHKIRGDPLGCPVSHA